MKRHPQELRPANESKGSVLSHARLRIEAVLLFGAVDCCPDADNSRTRRKLAH
jgi:hypothetical protein